MAANFKDALKQRRTYYALSNKSLISDQEIEEIISHVLLIVWDFGWYKSFSLSNAIHAISLL